MSDENVRKIVCVFLAAIMLGTTFAMCVSMDAEALEFVDSTTIDPPWTTSFTPLDSAWDSTGTQCVVVGNETNGKDPSAWLYNEPSNQWHPILEGTDPGMKVNKKVINDNTGIVYSTIQLAINNATAGDTILLWAGTYNERITINKAINIEGNGSANTVINGNNTGTVIRVESNWVNISHVKVTGGSSYTGILLYNVNNCRVDNCTVENNLDGIVISGASNNVIKDNDVRDNAGTGVKTESSDTTKKLFGLTYEDGLKSTGAMYGMEMDGANYSMTHSFYNGQKEGRPYYEKFIQDNVDTNVLYAPASNGIRGSGTIYTIRKDGSGYRAIYNFTGPVDGNDPMGLVLSGSYLYGTAYYGGSNNYGTIFRMNKDGTDFSVLHNFSSSTGSNPVGTMVLDGGILYGMTGYGGTSSYGTIYRINTDGTGYSVLYNFASSGRYPRGSLTLDMATGTLYGMASSGGASSIGVIFKIATSGASYMVMHSFTGGGATGTGSNPYGSLLMEGDNLYGMARQGGEYNFGTLFRIYKNGTGMTVLYKFNAADGVNPSGDLVQDLTFLYGFTSSQGPGTSYGTAFSFRKSTLAYLVTHSFTGAPDGAYLYGSPFLSGGYIYGFTNGGGNLNGGTAFSMSASGTNYFIRRHFDPSTTNSYYPFERLTQADGYLYGMTGEGGYYDYGMIFRTDLDGRNMDIMREFTGPDGSYSYGGTFLADGSVLYGTRSSGGSISNGVLFKMNTDGTGFSVLVNFDGATMGEGPRGELLQIGSTLYGTCGYGGLGGRGNIYKVNTDGSGFAVLHNFATGTSNGQYPNGGLTYDGTYLYGVTSSGGSSNFGVIYRIGTDGTGFTLLHHFTGGSTNGANPQSKLVMYGGNLYGTTSGGGLNSLGTIYRWDNAAASYSLLKSFSSPEGAYSYGNMDIDGSMLYGMTNSQGAYGHGSVFRFNINTMAFNVTRQFRGAPNDAGYASGCGPTVVVYAAQASTGNLIYHNNLIGNIIQATDDSTLNYWSDVYPIGGNYWGDYTDVDLNSDGIWDTPRAIPTAGAMDSYPFMRLDGWALPYTTFLSVAWDDVNDRFWVSGEFSAGVTTSLYYIPASAPTTMVPILGPASTFSALAVDDSGNVLLGGNGMDFLIYYRPMHEDGFFLADSVTSDMKGWNVTDITYNPNDSRFYVVGTVKNQDRGVAFVTDMGPFSADGHCYRDTSGLLNSPGIKGLKSISWNPDRNYAIAVGDGVYRLNQWSGMPDNKLSWSTIAAPKAGTYYHDISWDMSVGNEAGIVGVSALAGKYWRYYHTNPTLIDGYTSGLTGTEYMTCAMKPPSSPKWLIIPASAEIPRINLEEKDESGTLTFTSDVPNIFTVQMWKQSDVTRPDLMRTQVDAGGTYTFFIEGNYTVGVDDDWADLHFSISAWFDGGATGAISEPGDPTWDSDIINYRTRQFSLSYSAAGGAATWEYPTLLGGSIQEFSLHSYWADPNTYGTDGHTYRVYINVTFGPQSWAADGGGFMVPSDGSWDKGLALRNAGSWDLQVHARNIFNSDIYNLTYKEFGIKEYGAISSWGNPTGSAPPGTPDHYLSPDCVIHYASNTPHFVSVSIPDLYMNGDPLNPNFIPAINMRIMNTHSLALASNSDISTETAFSGPGAPLYIWGIAGSPLPAPFHGTESAGPLYSDSYAAYYVTPFEETVISWWINVPVSVAQGMYRGTITITISG